MKFIAVLAHLAAALAVCTTDSWGAEAATEELPQVRILFLGNSYMAINRLPAMVGELLLSSKLFAPHIGSNLEGNYTLERHTTNPEGLALMKQGADDGKPWDVIVVQEHSVVSAAAAVDADARQLMQNGLSKLVKSANELNPKVLVVDFQVWPRHENLWKAKDADALITGRNPGEAHARIHVANLQAVAAARQNNPGARILVSPVGDFWWLMHDLYPALPLYAEDGTHPDMLGTLLSAYVIAGSIGGREVIEQATWRPDCPAADVERVKKMVLDHPEVFKAGAK
jgi:hypothetical protein